MTVTTAEPEFPLERFLISAEFTTDRGDAELIRAKISDLVGSLCKVRLVRVRVDDPTDPTPLEAVERLSQLMASRPGDEAQALVMEHHP